MVRLLNDLSMAPIACALAFPATLHASDSRPPLEAHRALETCAELACRADSDAYRDALDLQQAVDQLVRNPADGAEERLDAVRDAWIRSRPSCGQTEVSRFYEEVVVWHGGEAPKSRDRFAHLTRADRAALLRFLDSL